MILDSGLLFWATL